MTSVSEELEERKNIILNEDYILCEDSDSGVTWYEDEDEEAAYSRAVAEFEYEVDQELGITSFIVMKDGKMCTQRIKNLDKFNKKDVAAIFQNGKIVYKNQYFRMLLSA